MTRRTITLFTLGLLALFAAGIASTIASAQAEQQLYTLRVTGLAVDGVMIPPPIPTPTPEPEPTAVSEPPVVYAASCGYGEPTEWFANWDASERCYAVSQAYCESTMNPYAVAPSGLYHGLFQIGELWFVEYGVDWELRYDPYVNSELARMIVQDYGWGPWECR